MMPVLSLMLLRASFVRLNKESNIAGTPCRPVHRSISIAFSVEEGSKTSAGYTIFPPCVKIANRPRTSPKQWNSGGGQHSMSVAVNFKRSPMKRELLTTLLGIND